MSGCGSGSGAGTGAEAGAGAGTYLEGIDNQQHCLAQDEVHNNDDEPSNQHNYSGSKPDVPVPGSWVRDAREQC